MIVDLLIYNDQYNARVPFSLQMAYLTVGDDEAQRSMQEVAE